MSCCDGEFELPLVGLLLRLRDLVVADLADRDDAFLEGEARDDLEHVAARAPRCSPPCEFNPIAQ
jgi:hypothetical protein